MTCKIEISASCLQVFALRRPFIHKILDYEDEFFALLMLVLETHSLRTTGESHLIYMLLKYPIKQIKNKKASQIIMVCNIRWIHIG